jgi:hypothetical protein
MGSALDSPTFTFTKKIILDTSDEAAKPHIMDGWLSVVGFSSRTKVPLATMGLTRRPGITAPIVARTRHAVMAGAGRIGV